MISTGLGGHLRLLAGVAAGSIRPHALGSDPLIVKVYSAQQ